MPTVSSPEADNQALLRFVERFALVLAENGVPRMAARVFAFALADDADRPPINSCRKDIQ